MGLCDIFGLKLGLCVIARFRKLRGTKDNGWFFYKYSFICASRRILFIDEEKIPKNPANSMRATLACLFTCVCIAHVL